MLRRHMTETAEVGMGIIIIKDITLLYHHRTIGNANTNLSKPISILVPPPRGTLTLRVRARMNTSSFRIALLPLLPTIPSHHAQVIPDMARTLRFLNSIISMYNLRVHLKWITDVKRDQGRQSVTRNILRANKIQISSHIIPLAYLLDFHRNTNILIGESENEVLNRVHHR